MNREDNYDHDEYREDYSEELTCPGCDDIIDLSEMCWECDCCRDCCECLDKD